jgi:regulator of protease activity HflC (stomatin/prohibitin superfamily)
MPTLAIVFVALIVVGLLLVTSTVKIVQEYERGVIFRLGRLVGARGPGLFFLIPYVERMRKIDLRIVTLEVPAQEAITRDNVTVKVNAVVYFRVVNPEDAVVKAMDFIRATSLVAQTTLRSILGQSDLDHPAQRARQDQPVAAVGHRYPDLRLGRQSHQRRGPRPGAAPNDAAGHGASS